MVQVYNSVTTIQLYNPLTQMAQIEVSVGGSICRLIGRWMSPPVQVSLAPGEQITVTVSIIAGSPVPQGSNPRIAIEEKRREASN